MRNLKILILLFGAAGVAAMAIDMEVLKHGFKNDLPNTLMYLGGFGIAAVMGLLGVMKPPAVAWQGAVALAGFALAGVKIRVWEELPRIADNQPLLLKIAIPACVGGALVSLLATIKPENKS